MTCSVGLSQSRPVLPGPVLSLSLSLFSTYPDLAQLAGRSLRWGNSGGQKAERRRSKKREELK